MSLQMCQSLLQFSQMKTPLLLVIPAIILQMMIMRKIMENESIIIIPVIMGIIQIQMNIINVFLITINIIVVIAQPMEVKDKIMGSIHAMVNVGKDILFHQTT